MHESTREKARHLAADVMRHFITGSDPGDGKENAVVRRGIQICKILAEEPHTAEQIAERLQIHPNTVFEYLSALTEGGVPIQKSGGIFSNSNRTGRPQSVFWI